MNFPANPAEILLYHVYKIYLSSIHQQNKKLCRRGDSFEHLSIAVSIQSAKILAPHGKTTPKNH
jgi:hypothetical protein